MPGREQISPGKPLRGVRLLRPGAAEPAVVAEADAQQREQAAYERGLAKGQETSKEQLQRQRQEFDAVRDGVLTSLRQAASDVVRQSEGALIELALEIATKLVAEVPISAERVETTVRSTLQQAAESTEFHISLHPEDLALLRECQSPILEPGSGREAMHFQACGDVSRGGCLVRTRFGLIDARPETKLQLIRESLGV